MTTTVEIQPAHSRGPEPRDGNLFLIKEIEDAKDTIGLPESDLEALRSVTDWIRTFVIQPHGDLGRPGPVCPYTPVALEHEALWLAPERIAGRTASEVIQLIQGYQRQLLAAQPHDGIGGDHKSILIVFTDLQAGDAKPFFEGALQQIGLSSYADLGLVMGPFYEGNDGTAIYNVNFRPFTSPVPFLLMRRAVVSDWKFFLNNEDLFDLWARRYGQAGTNALAEELRRLPWNARRTVS